MVNFIYPYEELRAANVAGTREVIRLAALGRGIPVHYVSSTAVLAGLGVMGVREVTEDTPLAYPERLGVGYVETKFVAEELLRSAGRAGLPVAIYRPLDIIGSRRTGAWNTATEMCALIRFITDTGLAPGIDLPLDFVPADTCAAAIRHISSLAGATGRTYHLASPKYALLGSLVGRLRDHGFEVREIPFDDWVSELMRYAAQNPSHPMTPFLPLFVDLDQKSGLTLAEMYLEHVFPNYTRSNTEQALRGSGVAFPPIDGRLLDPNIAHLIATGYLRTPGQPPAPLSEQSQVRSQGPSQVPGRPADAGPPLSRLGVVRHRPGRPRQPGRILRGPEPGERARRVPAGDHPVSRAQRAFPHHQRIPVRGPGGGRDDRPGRQCGGGKDGPGDDPYGVAWWSPDPRPVLSVGQVHLGRNVRKQLRRGDERTTANTRFRQVAEECRAGREPRWLTDPLLGSLIELHQQGWAHSIEVWLDGDLIGGAMGIGIGAVISGDSLFSRHPGAASIAVADMAARLGSAGGLLVRRAMGQPLPALARRHADAARALPAAARALRGADSAPRSAASRAATEPTGQ